MNRQSQLAHHGMALHSSGGFPDLVADEHGRLNDAVAVVADAFASQHADALEAAASNSGKSVDVLVSEIVRPNLETALRRIVNEIHNQEVGR